MSRFISGAGRAFRRWRNRQGAFGWFAYSPPRWVNAIPGGVRLYGLALRLRTKINLRQPFTPVELPDLSAVPEDALNAELRNLSAQRGVPLQLASSPFGAIGIMTGSKGDDSGVPPDTLAARRVIAAYGVQLEPSYWAEDFYPPVSPRDPDWAPAFGAFGTVGGLVGEGFDAYCRILHPLRRCETGAPTRWADEPDARLDDPSWRPDQDIHGNNYQDEGLNQHTAEGLIPPEVRHVLDEYLTTRAAGQVVQAVWDGYSLNIEAATRARIDQPERELVPLVGEFRGIAVLDDCGHTPALIYPVTGEWSVACDVDTMSTYVAGPRDLIDALLAEPRLEATQVRPDDPVG